MDKLHEIFYIFRAHCGTSTVLYNHIESYKFIKSLPKIAKEYDSADIDISKLYKKINSEDGWMISILLQRYLFYNSLYKACASHIINDLIYPDCKFFRNNEDTKIMSRYKYKKKMCAFLSFYIRMQQSTMIIYDCVYIIKFMPGDYTEVLWDINPCAEDMQMIAKIRDRIIHPTPYGFFFGNCTILDDCAIAFNKACDLHYKWLQFKSSLRYTWIVGCIQS
jgi:hypothetical protein